MVDWGNIIRDKELLTKKKERARTYTLCKAKEEELPKLADEGWVKVKSNKTSIVLKKEKDEEAQFVDNLWVMFANMGFSELNESDDICIPYKDSDEGYPVSIIAADGETVIIVEVKYKNCPDESRFDGELDFFQRKIGEMMKSILNRFPKAKVKFIWVTHNIIMQRKDLDRMSTLHIAHFDNSTISYYVELVKHIGSASKYQLLGNLFAKQEIANMDNRIPAIQGKMGGHTYYSFSIEPEKLLKIGYVLHRNEANDSMMPTYQRLIKKKRLQQVREFVNNGGYFPNSIIISIDTDGKGLEFEQASMRGSSTLSKIGILHLPRKYHSAYIIDGQHRLYGYSDSKYAMTNSIPVVAFVDLDRAEQIKIFMDINENQKAVPKTLRVTLNADMLWDSENYNEQRQALRSKIAQLLGEKSTSPLKDRVIIGEAEQTALRTVTIETIQKALARTSFFSKFEKNNRLIKSGSFDCGSNEATCNLFYPFIEEVMRYFQTKCEFEWNRDDKEGILVINRGIYGIILVLDDIVNFLMSKDMLFPLEQSPQDMMQLISVYLLPLVDYINNISQEDRRDLMSYLGEGGFTRFLRTFEKVINEKIRYFSPDGLNAYWQNHSMAYNDDSNTYIQGISRKLKDIIQDKLEKKFGDSWLMKGLPKETYLRITKDVENAEYEAVQNGLDTVDLNPWEFVDLPECLQIVVYSNNWSSLFQQILTRPGEESLSGGKDAKVKWIATVNDIKKKMSSKNYSVSSEEHSFLSDVYAWITEILIID